MKTNAASLATPLPLITTATKIVMAVSGGLLSLILIGLALWTP